jgi:hypothetical protein
MASFAARSLGPVLCNREIAKCKGELNTVLEVSAFCHDVPPQSAHYYSLAGCGLRTYLAPLAGRIKRRHGVQAGSERQAEGAAQLHRRTSPSIWIWVRQLVGVVLVVLLKFNPWHLIWWFIVGNWVRRIMPRVQRDASLNVVICVACLRDHSVTSADVHLYGHPAFRGMLQARSPACPHGNGCGP